LSARTTVLAPTRGCATKCNRSISVGFGRPWRVRTPLSSSPLTSDPNPRHRNLQSLVTTSKRGRLTSRQSIGFCADGDDWFSQPTIGERVRCLSRWLYYIHCNFNLRRLPQAVHPHTGSSIRQGAQRTLKRRPAQDE